MRRRALLSCTPVRLILVSLVAGTTSVEARQQPLSVGLRVSVSRPGRSVLVGSVARLSADSFWLRLPDLAEPYPIGYSEPAGIERSLGYRSHAGKGALIGLVSGATAAGAFLTLFCSDSDNACGADEVARAALFIAGPPTLVGAGIGFLIRSERWQALALPSRKSSLQHFVGIALKLPRVAI